MTDKKSDSKEKNASTGLNFSNFKPVEAPKRKAGLAENQVSISKHSITVPLAIANKLGAQVALLYSDTDKAIALAKSADGQFKLKQVGKLKSTRAVYCKTFIEAKQIKKGRYTSQWDEKNQMLVARVG